MDPLHRLLQRQLRKHFGAGFVPAPEWESFLKVVNAAYHEFEADRVLVETSLELSSQELQAANSELRAVFQALPDLVMRLDLEGTILARSDGTNNLVLSRIHAKVGQKIQDTLTPPLAEAFTQALKRVVISKAVASFEYACGAENHTVFCEARLVPHLENHIVAIIRNITERKRAESELEKAHHDLLEVSRQAGMAEVATGVLHNVGNVLNSVNVSSSCLLDLLQNSKLSALSKLVALLREHTADLGRFITEDSKGRQFPLFLEQLSVHLNREHESMHKEICELRKHVDHIRDIVTMQQNFARVSGIHETVDPAELMNDALHMNLNVLHDRSIQIVQDYRPGMKSIMVEKHKVLQILINLIRNASQSCEASGRPFKQITLQIYETEDGVDLLVADNGVGIPPENLNRIFVHGFTTKRDGHGFGLHSGALAAKEMGGSLSVESGGLGHGAQFRLHLPCARRSDSRSKSSQAPSSSVSSQLKSGADF